LTACQRFNLTPKVSGGTWNSFMAVQSCLRTVEKRLRQTLSVLMKQLEGSDQAERCLEFSYTLNSTSSEAHVGIVTYQGNGGDTNMHALLIKPFDAVEAGLVFWTNNGIEWAQEPDVSIPSLPYAGVIRVETNERSLEFYVDSKLVISLDAERLPFLKGALGIRWIGSTINRIAKDVEPV